MSTAEKLEQYLHDVAVAKQHREKNGITLVDLSTDAVATPTVHKGTRCFYVLIVHLLTLYSRRTNETQITVRDTC
jgi:hypothetical protein